MKELNVHLKDQYVAEMITEIETIQKKNSTGSFEWVDGIVIKCMKRGYWLLMENVNFCNPSICGIYSSRPFQSLFCSLFCACTNNYMEFKKKVNAVFCHILCLSCDFKHNILCFASTVRFERQESEKRKQKKAKRVHFCRKLFCFYLKRKENDMLFLFDTNQNRRIVFLIDKLVGKNKEFIRVDAFAKGEQTIPF